MKKTTLFLSALCAVLTALSATVFTACNSFQFPGSEDHAPNENPGNVDPPNDGGSDENEEPVYTTSFKYDLNYTESTDKINNPDQGFYRPILVRMTESGASYNKNIVTDATQLYHLRIDISAFSGAVNGTADTPLSDEALQGLDELLSYLHSKEKSAVVRLAYDPNYAGSANKEPAMETVLKHIEQACEVFNRYETTVTAIEAGLFGPWGEMHTSTVATAENIVAVTDKYLNETVNLPVLVRTPKMIYNYLGITLNEAGNYAISKDDKAYRLGIFNDGYLGSSTDLGTYTDRERDIAFLKNQTGHLPYGGEVVVPGSTLHDIENCTSEMFELNLSYLDVEWNDTVIKKWKETYYSPSCGSEENYYGLTAYTYIDNRLGYRFVLRDSVLKLYSDKFEISLNIENAGFGNLTKEKFAEIILADTEGNVAEIIEVQNFDGNGAVQYSFETHLDVENYYIYLRLYGEKTDGAPAYTVQFANDGLWNEDLKANLIGVPVK